MHAAMAEFAFFLLFYSVPFLALFLLPRLRWLAIGAGFALLLVGALLAVLQRSSGDAGIAAFLTFVVVTLGFVSGGVGRLALIALGPRGKGRKTTLLVAAVAYATLPALIVIRSQVREQQHRRRYAPPTAECRQKLHKVRVADATLYLPLLSGISLSESRTIGRLTTLYPPEKAREFCERAEKETPSFTAVRVDFLELEASPVLRNRPPCDRPRPQAWWPALCRYERGARVEIYSFALFDPARYDSERMLSFTLDSSDERAPLGPPWKRGADGFARAESQGAIYLRGSMGPGLRSRWIARCVHQSSSATGEQVWRCRAGYPMEGRVGLTYDFTAGLDTLAADARRIDGQVFAVATSLMQGDGAVPARR